MKHEKVLTKPLRKLEETKARQYSFSGITIHLELVVLSDGLLWLFFYLFCTNAKYNKIIFDEEIHKPDDSTNIRCTWSIFF